MSDRKILYQLTTKDGIKSEIREADEFMLSLRFAEKQKLSIYAGPCLDTREIACNSRTYTMRRHTTVEFVEYEEE